MSSKAFCLGYKSLHFVYSYTIPEDDEGEAMLILEPRVQRFVPIIP